MVSVQVDALPRNASVELQPVAADPATSSLDDDDFESKESVHISAAVNSRGSVRTSGSRMEGWIGRLQNLSKLRCFQVGNYRLELLTEALFSPGKMCRCHTSLSLGSASESGQFEKPMAFNGSCSADSNRDDGVGRHGFADCESSVAASVVTGVRAFVVGAELDVADIAVFKLFWQKENKGAFDFAHALQQKIETEFSPLCVMSVPVRAVGPTAILDSMIFLEVLAVA